jgi:hypothetical protein
VGSMAPEPRKKRSVAPPEQGWTLGADGFPPAAWIALAALLGAFALLLMAVGYIGYGAMIAILAAAAAVNLT